MLSKHAPTYSSCIRKKPWNEKRGSEPSLPFQGFCHRGHFLYVISYQPDQFSFWNLSKNSFKYKFVNWIQELHYLRWNRFGVTLNSCHKQILEYCSYATQKKCTLLVKIVMWLGKANQSALFQHSRATLLKTNLWYWHQAW